MLINIKHYFIKYTFYRIFGEFIFFLIYYQKLINFSFNLSLYFINFFLLFIIKKNSFFSKIKNYNGKKKIIFFYLSSNLIFYKCV